MAPIPPRIKKQEEKSSVDDKEIKLLHETDEVLEEQIRRNKGTAKSDSEKAYTRSVEWVEEQEYVNSSGSVAYASVAGNSTTSGTATYANSAGSASSAGYATSAGTANSANTANTANTANSANSANSVPWTGVQNTITGGNEFNVCDSTPSGQRFWFNYKGRGGSNLGSAITEYYFGNGQSGNGGTSLYAGNFYANNNVSCQSDIRYKKVIDSISIDVNKIAEASIIRFKWKDGRDDEEHVGGIAQEWKEIIPETVIEKDGILTMNYGSIGVASVISLARKVVELQKRIEELEKRYGK